MATKRATVLHRRPKRYAEGLRYPQRMPGGLSKMQVLFK